MKILFKIAFLALALGAALSPAAAQDTRQIQFATPPAGWVEGNFRGYLYATPADWQEVARSDDGVTLFGGNMETQTGPAFGLLLERDPMQLFTPGTTTPLGEVTFAKGLRFNVLHSKETPEPGITIEGELLISVDPVLGKDHLVILQSAYKQPLDDHRTVLAQILATLDLPAPGVLPLEPALAGAFAAPVPEGWETGSYMDAEVLIFENPAIQGEFKLMRHDASFDPTTRSDWYMPDETPGQPTLFLGQNAVVFEWSKPSKKYHDATDSDEITRLYIFETCLPDGDVASVELTGLPSFYADPQVNRLLDLVELRLGSAAAPCPASALPVGMVTGASDPQRRRDGGSTYYVPEPAIPDTWQAHSVDGMQFALPPSWTGGPVDGGWSSFMSAKGEYELALTLVPSPPAASANPAEVQLADGTRFLRQKAVDGETLVSALPVAAAGHLMIVFKGGMLDGPGFADILQTFRMTTPAEATVASGPVSALDGLLSYQPVEGFVTMTHPESLTFMAEDGRGYLTIAKGAAVLAPNGFAALVPAGRLGSYEQGFFMDWSAYGWPTPQPEFMDNGTLAKGWHMVHFARSCLPGQIPVAKMFGGIDRFTSGNALKDINSKLTFNWPEGMEPCTLENAGVGNPATGGLGASSMTVPAETPPEAAQNPTPAPVATETPPAPSSATQPQIALPPPPPAPATTPLDAIEPDTFTDQGSGYALYQNTRFGTEISYPSSYFTAETPPDNGDGRRFSSAEGQSYFLIFGQHDVFGLSQDEMIQQDKASGGYDSVTYEKAGKGWYVLSGFVGDAIFYRKVVLTPDAIIHLFEIRYPTSQKAAFDPVVAHMAQSFGPMPAAQLLPSPAKPLPQAKITTPARNTDLRAALMNAARIPIEAELGMKVIFVVSVLKTDGQWAYLQAQPRNPDGTKINWSKTRFAHEMEIGVMSDVAMVLLQNTSAGWQVVDHIMGPTDVYWLGWLETYALPKSLFSE